MSVYSGFATRQQQKRYNECLEYALSILTKRLYRFYIGESCNESKFIYLLTSIHDKMQQLEESKYLTPHYSHILSHFLKETADVVQKVSQLSMMKEEDPFNQTFSKLKESQYKIKFNTLEHQPMDEFQERSKPSRLTINERKVNFKTRVKTNTPQHHSKPQFFTPQKMSRLDALPEDLKEKIEDEHFFQVAERPMRPLHQLKRQKIQNHHSKSQQLSPRQFLRQTVKGKQSFAHVGARTKQKHQKMVKI